MTVFNLQKPDYTKQTLFFGETLGAAIDDKVKYSWIEKLTDKQQGFFWRPTEIDCYKDKKDFQSLTDHEQHIFTSNLKRQIILDSVQGRAPSLCLLPIASLPELEEFIQTWTFFETIHSRSYKHIIKIIYSNPEEVFQNMLDLPEVMDCAKDISKYYDDLAKTPICDGIDPGTFEPINYLVRKKKALWLCLVAINALEGIRFYASFACSWNFAEQKKMEGNAKIIKFIARDENIHLAFTQQLLKTLPQDDPDFAKIKVEYEPEVYQIYQSVINQEKTWARYLFKDGSMIGLNSDLLCDYVDFMGMKRMVAVGLKPFVKASMNNPLPWTQKWIAGSDVQVAPQETEITSYTVGTANNDVKVDSFKGFKL